MFSQWGVGDYFIFFFIRLNGYGVKNRNAKLSCYLLVLVRMSRRLNAWPLVCVIVDSALS